MLRRWETRNASRSQSVHEQVTYLFDQEWLSKTARTAIRTAQPRMLTLSFCVQSSFMVIRAVLLSMTVEPSHPLTMATFHVFRSSVLSRRTTTATPSTTDPAHVSDRANISDETGLAEISPARPVCV